MEHLFDEINETLNIVLASVSPVTCLGICFFWGMLSVLFCPCHLASIPMIISYIKGQKQMTVAYAFMLSLMFSFAMFLVICVIGGITVGLGKMFKESGHILDYAVGCVFVAVGLHLCGLLKYHHHDHCEEEEHDEHCGAKTLKYRKKGFLGAFVYGLFFGIILAPCTFGYMAPIMGNALKKAGDSYVFSFLMFLLYGLGNAFVIVFAGTFSEYISKYAHWSHSSKACNIIKIICGILIILAGVHSFFE